MSVPRPFNKNSWLVAVGRSSAAGAIRVNPRWSSASIRHHAFREFRDERKKMNVTGLQDGQDFRMKNWSGWRSQVSDRRTHFPTS